MRFDPRACVLAFGLLAAPAFAQPSHPIRVPYLETAPTMDGLLDSGLAALPSNSLTLQSSDGDTTAVRPPTYRVAYGPGFLYVFVEIETAQLTQRDRAYQNGDGVILVIARPDSGRAGSGRKPPSVGSGPQPGTTDEFYVLGFSPGIPAARWQQRFVWYRNVELGMRPLTDTVVKTASEGARSFFEILVPWSDVYPYHPWLSDAIGFNVCVTRALAGTTRARYCAVEDHRVDSEQNPRRYQPLAFEPGRAAGVVRAAAVLDRNHVSGTTPPNLRIVTLARAATTSPLTLDVFDRGGARVSSRRIPFRIAKGRVVRTLPLPVVAAGDYSIDWRLEAASGRLALTVLPPADVPSLRARLGKISARLCEGSRTTLRFQLDETDRRLRSLEPYDTAAEVRVSMEQILSDLREADAGRDAIATRTGMFRRAFLSQVDGELQPYSVKIPTGYDPATRYPLFVFLHGSGQDDRSELGRDWFPDGFIQLAPRARGTSNWYSADHAQEDIREAIEDVMRNYSVDATRIVLAGFSMGGYGVYRTYKEDPTRYRALAIFSGIPRIPGGNADGPDFLEREDLAIFARPPMFVFHGGNDRNCPIEQTRALVDRLKQAGAHVQFEFEPDKGHESPGESTKRAFRAWLEKAIGG